MSPENESNESLPREQPPQSTPSSSPPSSDSNEPAKASSGLSNGLNNNLEMSPHSGSIQYKRTKVITLLGTVLTSGVLEPVHRNIVSGIVQNMENLSLSKTRHRQAAMIITRYKSKLAAAIGQKAVDDALYEAQLLDEKADVLYSAHTHTHSGGNVKWVDTLPVEER